MMTAQSSGMWNEPVERDGAAEHFGKVAGADGNFAHQPVRPARPARIPVTTALRQILSSNDPEAGGDNLHEDRHDAGEPHHPKKSVLELRSALQVSAPVAGVHVADADEDGGPDEGPPLLPEAGLVMRAPLRNRGRSRARGGFSIVRVVRSRGARPDRVVLSERLSQLEIPKLEGGGLTSVHGNS